MAVVIDPRILISLFASSEDQIGRFYLPSFSVFRAFFRLGMTPPLDPGSFLSCSGRKRFDSSPYMLAH